MPPHVELVDAHDTLTQLLAVREGYGSPELVVAWAGAAIEQGFASASLLVLAGLGPTPNAFETQERFAAALDELGLGAPDAGHWRDDCVRLVCAGILDGSLDPRRGLAELHAQWERDGHRADLTFALELQDEIERLDDDVRLFYPDLTRANVVDTIRAEAQRWLERDLLRTDRS